MIIVQDYWSEDSEDCGYHVSYEGEDKDDEENLKFMAQQRMAEAFDLFGLW
jgi:hypothetical protein